MSEREIKNNVVSILGSCLYIRAQKRMILLTHFWVSLSCCSHQSSSCIYSKLIFNALDVDFTFFFFYGKTKLEFRELNV